MAEEVRDVRDAGEKPASFQSRFRDLENRTTNHEIFIDSWVRAVQTQDDEQRATAMLALAEMWDSLGA